MKSIYIRKTFEILLLLCAVLMAGCSGGGSSYNDMEDSDSGKLLVTLTVSGLESVRENSITADSGVTMSDIAFFYKATPQWTAKSVTGSTGGSFIRLSSSSYSDGQLSLGQFKAGEWRFDVEVRKIDSARSESDWTVLFTGSATSDIERGSVSATVTVEVDVEMDLSIDTRNTTTVDFEVSVPTGGTIVINYEGPGDISGTVADTEMTATDSEGWTLYSVTLTDMPSGEYTFTVEYQLNGDFISTSIIDVAALAGETAAITGSISAEEDNDADTVEVTLILQMPDFTMSLFQDGYSFICTVTDSTSDDISYRWYVNGVQQSGQTGTGFVLTGDAPGAYDVTCTASMEGRACSMTQSVTVAP